MAHPRFLDQHLAESLAENDRLRLALRAVNSELWWCAIQLGCNWKDKEWREKSSVGRAYDQAVAAVTDAERTKVSSQASGHDREEKQ